MADANSATKQCIRCRETKTIDCFTKHAQKKDGLNPYCKDCDRAWRQANPRLQVEVTKCPTEKLCRKCGQTKPASEFYPYKKSKDGFRSNCKECGKADTNSWYYQNHDKARAWQIAYAATRKEQKSAYDAKYREKHRERLIAYSRRHYANNKERHLAYSRMWVAANREKRKEISLAYAHRRRARMLQSGGSFTPAQIRDLHKKQKGKCAICRDKLKRNFHRDHIVPLARGGSNLIHNIQLLCKACNLRKNAKDPIDFMQSEGYLL